MLLTYITEKHKVIYSEKMRHPVKVSSADNITREEMEAMEVQWM